MPKMITASETNRGASFSTDMGREVTLLTDSVTTALPLMDAMSWRMCQINERVHAAADVILECCSQLMPQGSEDAAPTYSNHVLAPEGHSLTDAVLYATSRLEGATSMLHATSLHSQGAQTTTWHNDGARAAALLQCAHCDTSTQTSRERRPNDTKISSSFPVRLTRAINPLDGELLTLIHTEAIRRMELIRDSSEERADLMQLRVRLLAAQGQLLFTVAPHLKKLSQARAQLESILTDKEQHRCRIQRAYEESVEKQKAMERHACEVLQRSLSLLEALEQSQRQVHSLEFDAFAFKIIQTGKAAEVSSFPQVKVGLWPATSNAISPRVYADVDEALLQFLNTAASEKWIEFARVTAVIEHLWEIAQENHLSLVCGMLFTTSVDPNINVPNVDLPVGLSGRGVSPARGVSPLAMNIHRQSCDNEFVAHVKRVVRQMKDTAGVESSPL